MRKKGVPVTNVAGSDSKTNPMVRAEEFELKFSKINDGAGKIDWRNSK